MQLPLVDDRYPAEFNGLPDLGYDDEIEEEGDEEEGNRDPFRICIPGKWASIALNALIRLLISRIPRQRLCSFG